ncbi:TY5A [Symbiodinium sp. CCMP2592]|nr:TY5A [Symbiodinium sp. CCMP2592]
MQDLASSDQFYADVFRTQEAELMKVQEIARSFEVKPGRLGKAARKKAGLERKKCRGKAKREDSNAQHALADEVFEEEVLATENEEVMDFEVENSTEDVAEAIKHMGDLVEKMVAEAERKAELALEDWVRLEKFNLSYHK